MANSKSFIFDERYDFPRFEGTAKAYFICSGARVGGHFLSHLLWSTGSFGSPSEYVLNGFFDVWRKHLSTDTDLSTLCEIVARRTSPNGWFGMKLVWSQFQQYLELDVPPAVLQLRAYIYLSRQDVVAQAVSLLIARQTGQWISLDDRKNERVIYNRDAIDKNVRELTAENDTWEHFFDGNKLPVLKLYYEDVVADPQGAVDKVADLLQVRKPPRITQIPVESQSGAINDDWVRRYRAGL